MLCRSCLSVCIALWEFQQQQNTGKFKILSLYQDSQLIGFRMQVDLCNYFISVLRLGSGCHGKPLVPYLMLKCLRPLLSSNCLLGTLNWRKLECTLCFNAYKHVSTHAVCINTCVLYCFLRRSVFCFVIEMFYILCFNERINKLFFPSS